jgi:UDP-N-acetylglucosamine 2-epimerase (non-hydrolysing)
VTFSIAHTGQHYDPGLDAVFFEELDIPKPVCHLGVGSGPSGNQLGKMLSGLDPVLKDLRPDLVLVAGDTTSTLAGALAAFCNDVPVAHVEAGLRSGDRSMPEELNRIMVDAVADFLFATEQAALDNLARSAGDYPERPARQVFFTGNCMIDTLMTFREKAAAAGTVEQMGLTAKKFALTTLHRPSNVDTPEGLRNVIALLEQMSGEIRVVFPIHPRTSANLKKFDLENRLFSLKNLLVTAPQGYLEFLNLLQNAAFVLTDSGGIQDETTFLRIPCLTLRDNTERPVTITTGTNELLTATDSENLRLKVRRILAGQWRTGAVPDLWDGQSARRIAEILINNFPYRH